MSTKKRFTIAPDLASGIRSTMQSASHNQGQLHYDMMSVDSIETDPENPRQLSVSRNEILNGVNPKDPHYQTKFKEREALHELAESIKKIGIRNAIEVYKDGLKYRIVTGERRYWAAILAGQVSVPVRISQKPDEFNLRYTQWVENMNRQDLSLWEKYNNLIRIEDAYRKTNPHGFNEQTLQDLLAISSIQAYRYLSLLKADEMILQCVQLGKLNNLKIVQELVAMKNGSGRGKILSWIYSAKNEVTSLASYKEAVGKKVSLSKTTKRQSINLGKISSTRVAQQLMEIVTSDARLVKHKHEFKHIDWSSSKAITQAFKTLYKKIEKECSFEKERSVEEIA